MLWRRCPHCGKRTPVGEKCGCGYKREYFKRGDVYARYKTGRWKKLRATVISLYSGLDPWALAHGRVEAADTAHHIIPADEDGSLFYSLDNLIPLSRDSHAEVHALYRRSDKDKKDTQEALERLQKRVTV